MSCNDAALARDFDAMAFPLDNSWDGDGGTASLVDNDFNKEEKTTKRRFSLNMPLPSSLRRFRRSRSDAARKSIEEDSRESISAVGGEGTSSFIKRLYKDSHKGVAEAQFSLGYCFDVGSSGVEVDTEEAIHWYMQAAAQGHPIAQNNLGVLYSTGHRNRMKKNPPEALHWYNAAAASGNPNGQFHSGLALLNGEGVNGKDAERAFAMFKKAAKQGHVTAISNVGAMYMGGRGVERNYKKAIKWLKKGMAKGDSVSSHNLAVMYYKGYGTPVDFSQAEYCFMKALTGKTPIPQTLSEETRERGSTLYNT